MTYKEWRHKMACWGFTYVETTEAGYRELIALGFTPEDVTSIESDMQAGFSCDEAKAAISA